MQLDRIGKLTILGSLILLAACTSSPVHPPIPLVAQVDLERFMGDWFVIAAIPTALEKDAYNAVERYDMAADGTISTTFQFRRGSFTGPEKIYRPRGHVREGTGNAVWGMQFIWPFEADYRIVRLADDYRFTVIGRNERDYVWIMARTPTMDAEDYEEVVDWLEAQGYDTSRLRRVPHSWSTDQGQDNQRSSQ